MKTKRITDFYIYILSNFNNNVLYVGMTSNLQSRIYEHRNKMVQGFTKQYNVDKLVYFEKQSCALQAATRERQLKRWGKQKKIYLIVQTNPSWKDLYGQILL